jgi:predicted ATP-dependent endonuclease of OLD family
MQADDPLSLRIESLDINDLACFSSIHLGFSSQFNFICGANGVGKSTILAIIGQSFSGALSPEVRRRSASTSPGRWELRAKSGENSLSASSQTMDVSPQETERRQFRSIALPQSLLYFKANRDFIYQPLDRVSRDPPSPRSKWSAEAISGSF